MDAIKVFRINKMGQRYEDLAAEFHQARMALPSAQDAYSATAGEDARRALLARYRSVIDLLERMLSVELYMQNAHKGDAEWIPKIEDQISTTNFQLGILYANFGEGSPYGFTVQDLY